jgi:tRNA 2-thiouridine synthesizing protein A
VIPPSARLDVRRFACPMTWVKTRIALDRLAHGEVLEVWLLSGEPLASVPRSAEEDGHRVIAVEPLPAEGPESFRLLLEKKHPPAPSAGLP